MEFLKNISPREYQKKIFQTCKEKNCLVVLPTGLGKTLVALMLAIERMKSFPGEKVVFLAPTRPLVEQHYNYFQKNLPELFADMQIFTGSVNANQRKKIWQTADIIFSTPQCVANDLKKGMYNFEDVCLLIEDEAHRCVKNYSYTHVAKIYTRQAKNQRILGLTASPGSDAKKIREICEHLSVDVVELRTRDCDDVKSYLQNLEFKKRDVMLSSDLLEIREVVNSLFKKYVDELKNRRVLWSAPSKTELIKIQKKLMFDISRGKKDYNILLSASACAQAIRIQHALELLETQTVLGFVQYMEDLFDKAAKKESKGVVRLVSRPEFNFAFIKSKELLAKNVEHPKMNEIRKIVSEEISKNSEAKIMVFSQYRSTAARISAEMNSLNGVSAKVFVGQAKKSGKNGETGLSQKEQQKLVRDFSEGKINLLTCTSIGEEGLDVPEVNAVIFYEPVPSAIRTIQRRGRTARLKPGKLFVLVTKNTRDESYHWSSFHKEKGMYKAIKEVSKNIGGKKEDQSRLGF